MYSGLGAWAGPALTLASTAESGTGSGRHEISGVNGHHQETQASQALLVG
jgi:hypothetical protein